MVWKLPDDDASGLPTTTSAARHNQVSSSKCYSKLLYDVRDVRDVRTELLRSSEKPVVVAPRWNVTYRYARDNRMTDKIAALEPRDDATTLIRGTGFGMIGQFAWAILCPAGVIVPNDKIPTARQALEAMGYQLTTTTTGDTKRNSNIHTPTPPPECGNPDCSRPYPRGYQPTTAEHCQHCGKPLTLTQHNPDDDACEHCATHHDTPAAASPDRCPDCGNRIHPGRQNYCRCGRAVPAPERAATPARPIDPMWVRANRRPGPQCAGELIGPLGPLICPVHTAPVDPAGACPSCGHAWRATANGKTPAGTQ